MKPGKLEAAIAEAAEAQQRITELDALKAQAEGLDDLLAEKALAEELARAEAALRSVKAGARTSLKAAAQAATAWRRRFEIVAAEIETLVALLGEVQNQIYVPLQQLQRACEQVNSVGFEAAHPQDAAFGAVGTSYAQREGRAVSFERLLTEIGGTDPALACWPTFDGDPRRAATSWSWQLKEFLRHRRGIVVYLPSQGIRNFR